MLQQSRAADAFPCLFCGARALRRVAAYGTAIA